MLSGIDYYPKKKKQLKGKLFWVVLLFIILVGVWYYFQDLELSEGSSSTIIISRPIVDSEPVSLIKNQLDLKINTGLLWPHIMLGLPE